VVCKLPYPFAMKLAEPVVETHEEITPKANKPRGVGKWLMLAGAVLGIAAIVGIIAWQRSSGRVEYLTARLDRGDIESTVNTTGNLNAVISVQVGSQVSGNILALYADFNTKVKKGQVVALIDPALFQAAVDNAAATLRAVKAAVVTAQATLAQSKANLSSAEANIANQKANVVKAQSAVELARVENERRKVMVKTGSTSQEDSDTAQSNYDQAVASVDAANAAVTSAEAAADAARKGVPWSRRIRRRSPRRNSTWTTQKLLRRSTERSYRATWTSGKPSPLHSRHQPFS
jgi:HlyD family secretion protein